MFEAWTSTHTLVWRAGVSPTFTEELRDNFVERFGETSLTETVPHWWGMWGAGFVGDIQRIQKMLPESSRIKVKKNMVSWVSCCTLPGTATMWRQEGQVFIEIPKTSAKIGCVLLARWIAAIVQGVYGAYMATCWHLPENRLTSLWRYSLQNISYLFRIYEYIYTIIYTCICIHWHWLQ